MNEKLFDEIDEKMSDNDIDYAQKEEKKCFCLWLFVLSLVGGLLAMFLVKIPALLVCLVAIVLNIKYRKKYLVWPQMIVILPNLVLLIFYMLTFIFGGVTNNPM